MLRQSRDLLVGANCTVSEGWGYGRVFIWKVKLDNHISHNENTGTRSKVSISHLEIISEPSLIVFTRQSAQITKLIYLIDFRNGKKILGILLVILVNLAYIGSNYAVKWAGLGAGEVSLVRGALQILVFSAALIISTRVKSHRNNNNSESQKCKISRKFMYTKNVCQLAS